ncbi:hypothetical protein FAZ19_08430 [Sphingobacterium alkalisoli]|uniref:Hemin receptor n=1 Tax=Sphingobacterium alkalisoli TaxID=1874115 RepID=A0A4U0H5D8_9SPHI|nr:hypothetical protein [Sphingobacterium alkalisoli]TJY66920.1 hypothetical protein FAZ19_08430 [Sphingobacterium alkalisoli]GGH13389.1 hemin receptor [Sphingobacterium alkalisoli]
MTLKKIILSAFVTSAFWGTVQAQSVGDAILFSQESNGGSARFKGLGNAQTALGGDISTITGNPAGLGFFGRSDVSITFNYLQNTNKTTFEGLNTTSKKGNFGIDQAGIVFHFPTRKSGNLSSGILNFNVGLSYDKTQNYNNHLTYEGNNMNSSIVNALTDIMDGNTEFRSDFAGSNMVEQFGDATLGYFPLAIENGSKNQYNDILQKGNRSKTAIAFGANHSNKFYFGATLGLTSFRYEKSAQFIENGWTKDRAAILADNPNSDFADPTNDKYDFVEASYELFDNFSQITEGSGIDLKLGAIYKPTTDWNIGLTITTPTWTTVQEDTEAWTDIDFYDDEEAANSFAYYESKLYSSSSDHQLNTPWKFALGATKFFSRGLITADAEYIDYSTIKYNTLGSRVPANGSIYNTLNEDIKDEYQGAVNLRVGGEYLFNNIVSGRAGFNYFGNPYQYADDTNYSGSLGLGFKLTSSAYLDVAVVHQVNSYKQSPYVIDESFWGVPSPVASIDHNRTNVLLTLGAKF